MKLDPTFSFDLYPGLDAELDAAYERNAHAGEPKPEEIAAAGLGAAIADTLAIHDPLAELALPLKQELVEARAATVELLTASQNAPHEVPELDNEAFEHVNWGKIQTGYEAMQKAGMEPEIVISPLGLTPQYWFDLYRTLPDASDEPLHIDRSVQEAWDRLNPQHGWAVTVVPGIQTSVVAKVPHDLSMAGLNAMSLDKNITDVFDIDSISTVNEVLPDISTYLTLQAIRLNQDKPTINSSMWLHGMFVFKSHAAATMAFTGSNNRVSLVMRYEDDADHGIRPVVRG